MKKYDYFITLTFDPEYREFSDNFKFEVLGNFLSKLESNAPQIRYKIIPSTSRKGDLHFHLLTSGITPEDINCERVTKRGIKPIYDVVMWKYGYSTMVKIYKAVIL